MEISADEIENIKFYLSLSPKDALKQQALQVINQLQVSLPITPDQQVQDHLLETAIRGK